MEITTKIETLRDYLYFNRIKTREFADKARITPCQVINICNYKFVPKIGTAVAIADATDGVFTAEQIIWQCASHLVKEHRAKKNPRPRLGI